MKASQDKVVAVSYKLEVEGKIADQSAEGKPLEYIHGSGMLLPKFEQNIEGKEPGDTFDFILEPEEGYGTYNPQYKVEIPKSSFEVEGKLREDLLTIGNIIPMFNSAGQVMQGVVAAIGAETVTMDFNHPMAGKTLHFTGKVETVREASDKELVDGLCGGCHGEGGCCHGEEGCCHEEGGCCHEEGGCEGHGEGKKKGGCKGRCQKK